MEISTKINNDLSLDTQEVFTSHSKELLSGPFNWISSYCFNCKFWKRRPIGISNNAYDCNNCCTSNPFFIIKSDKKDTIIYTRNLLAENRREYLPQFILLEKYCSEKIKVETVVSVIYKAYNHLIFPIESLIVSPVPEQKAIVYWL